MRLLDATRRLVLGTAQFGLPYGIANKSGQVGSAEGRDIVKRAWDAGVDAADTAITYGNAESLLGEIGIVDWRVISKLPEVPKGVDISIWVRRLIHESLVRLNVPSLYGLLLHQPNALHGPHGNQIYAAMLHAKNEGLVKKIGISAYGPDDIEPLIKRFRLDLVQAPLSVVDRRVMTSGCVDRMCDAGIEFHARSVFLQGLLLMTESQRPTSFARWSKLWEAWHGWLNDVGLTPLQACLAFVASAHGVSGNEILPLEKYPAPFKSDFATLTAFRTKTPPRRNLSHNAEPMKPSAPVTRTFMSQISFRQTVRLM